MHDTKKRLAYLASLLLMFAITSPLLAYDEREIYIESENYGQGLDLNAVASLFGRSQDLADFEWRLNDPSRQISNLDLDGNGEVDYLRVIETSQHEVRLIVIQAVVGRDRYQDVATIEVARDRYNETSIQIVGDPYLYGSNYIIEPSYSYVPLIYDYFWGNRYYKPYYSRYKWGHYPRAYRAWRPHPVPYYNQHIGRHIDGQNHYRQTQTRRSTQVDQMHKSMQRDDYARQYPDRSHTTKREPQIDQRGVPENRSYRQHDNGDMTIQNTQARERSSYVRPTQQRDIRQNTPQAQRYQERQTNHINNRQTIEPSSDEKINQMRERLHLQPQNNQQEEKESSSHQNMIQMREKLHLQ